MYHGMQEGNIFYYLKNIMERNMVLCFLLMKLWVHIRTLLIFEEEYTFYPSNKYGTMGIDKDCIKNKE